MGRAQGHCRPPAYSGPAWLCRGPRGFACNPVTGRGVTRTRGPRDPDTCHRTSQAEVPAVGSPTPSSARGHSPVTPSLAPARRLSQRRQGACVPCGAPAPTRQGNSRSRGVGVGLPQAPSGCGHRREAARSRSRRTQEGIRLRRVEPWGTGLHPQGEGPSGTGDNGSTCWGCCPPPALASACEDDGARPPGPGRGSAPPRKISDLARPPPYTDRPPPRSRSHVRASPRGPGGSPGTSTLRGWTTGWPGPPVSATREAVCSLEELPSPSRHFLSL